MGYRLSGSTGDSAFCGAILLSSAWITYPKNLYFWTHWLTNEHKWNRACKHIFFDIISKWHNTKLIKIKKGWHRFCFETAMNFLRKNWNIQVWYIQPRGSVLVNTNWESFGRIIIQRNYRGWTWKFLFFFFLILHFKGLENYLCHSVNFEVKRVYPLLKTTYLSPLFWIFFKATI